MTNFHLSEDAKVILLLCGNFKKSPKPSLTHGEYNRVVAALKEHNLRPSDLLDSRHVDLVAPRSGLTKEHLHALMQRGAQLAFNVEEWNRSGIWVLCRSDDEYPKRLKVHLKDKAPPILYCAGERSLLKGGGVAIVGSRDVDETGEAFARRIADWSVKNRGPIVSGGARGVDQIAMKAAIDAGGAAIGLLADSLLKKSVSREARYAISDGRLLLISAYAPDARFQVWNAMDRNKHIYAMADIAVVVSSNFRKGGTWEGATEELRRKNARPVFVRIDNHAPKGNLALLDHGAIAFPSDIEGSTLEEMRIIPVHPKDSAERELDLFSYAEKNGVGETEYRPEVQEDVVPVPQNSEAPDQTIYDVVVPVIQEKLRKPLTPNQLAEQLDLQKGQLNVWLKRALSEGKLRKLSKPVRYVRIESPS